jgi:multidrug transporter EmrE-like cation transporter
VFAVGFLVSMILFALTGGFGQRAQLKRVFLPALLLAGCIGGNVLPQLILPKYMPAVVQYPLLSGSNIICATLIGALAFHERLPKRAYAAMGVGVCAVVLLSL